MDNHVSNGIVEKNDPNTFTMSRECDINKIEFDNNEKKIEVEHGECPEKTFVYRESELTVLFHNPQVKTIVHLFVIFMFSLACATIIRGFVEYPKYPWYILIQNGFGNIHLAIACWMLHYCLTCSTFFFFKAWATIRTKVSMKSTFKKLLDIPGILIILGYYIFSFRLAEYLVTICSLTPASALALLMEQTRMLMKVHAFIKSNIPKVLKYGTGLDKNLVLPSFTHFIFFTFAPTLIYKDEYPRTKTVRWGRVAVQIIEILAVILSLNFIAYSLVYSKHYQDFGARKYTYLEILWKMVDILLPSFLVLYLLFFIILHQVQNLFAELLRFADRMFYSDWWTAKNLTVFFKKWNLIVHEWLNFYVYSEIYQVFQSKTFAKCFTFFLSSFVHEWILINAFGFFFPILFFSFISGALLSFIRVPKHSFFNILILLAIAVGMSVINTCYTLEFIARSVDVPPRIEKLDFYIPRSLTCDCYEKQIN